MAVALAASLTLMVKVDEPVPLGAPLILPAEESSDNPAGSVPELTEKVYGEVPLETLMTCEYGEPVCPLGSEVVVIWGAGLMITAYACDPDCEPLEAVTVKLNVPTVIGRPLIAPEAGFSNRPGGSDPVEDQAQPDPQPEAWSVCE